MKTYNKINQEKDQINYSRIIQLLIIAILIFLFFKGLKLVAPEASVGKMDDNEELYRLALIQTFKRDYNQAIESYKDIIERDSSECFAYQCLSELFLVKGLEEFDVELSKSYLLESHKNASNVLSIYENDLVAIVMKSLALINLSEYYEDDSATVTDLLVSGISEIQRGLKINDNYSDFWFAMGEWWTYAENLPLKKREAIIKHFFPNLELFDNGFSCLNVQALEAYQKSVDCRASTVKGLFGKMRGFLIEHNYEEFYSSMADIRTFTNYFPLENYYLERAQELWKSVEQFRQNQRKEGALGYYEKIIPQLSLNQ